MAKRMWLKPQRNHIFEASQIPAFIAILPILHVCLAIPGGVNRKMPKKTTAPTRECWGGGKVPEGVACAVYMNRRSFFMSLYRCAACSA